jgi:hypothetical protein
MNDHERLVLITESVHYCQKVKALGMPANCFSKALREPIFFLWEMRNAAKKEDAARYRSVASVGLRYGKREIVYDHAIPFKYLQHELLSLEEATTNNVKEVLDRYCVTAIITAQENAALSQAGLQHKMPADWNGIDSLARYRAVGVQLTENSAYAVNLCSL